VLPFSLRYGFGLGFWPTMVALVLLALPPIFTNTYTGVRDAPADAVEAAQGMGMRAGELMRRVEVPSAAPLILTGLRVSTVQVIATATLGALVGYRNLGTLIVTGYTSPDKGPMLAGAFAVILVALVTDGLFVVAQRVLVPWRRPVGRGVDATVVAEEAEPVEEAELAAA
jgi:osmoprotectant transport system permease protein